MPLFVGISRTMQNSVLALGAASISALVLYYWLNRKSRARPRIDQAAECDCEEKTNLTSILDTASISTICQQRINRTEQCDPINENLFDEPRLCSTTRLNIYSDKLIDIIQQDISDSVTIDSVEQNVSTEIKTTDQDKTELPAASENFHNKEISAATIDSKSILFETLLEELLEEVSGLNPVGIKNEQDCLKEELQNSFLGTLENETVINNIEETSGLVIKNCDKFVLSKVGDEICVADKTTYVKDVALEENVNDNQSHVSKAISEVSSSVEMEVEQIFSHKVSTIEALEKDVLQVRNVESKVTETVVDKMYDKFAANSSAPTIIHSNNNSPFADLENANLSLADVAAVNLHSDLVAVTNSSDDCNLEAKISTHSSSAANVNAMHEDAAAVSMDSDLVSVTNNTNDSNLEAKISTHSSSAANANAMHEDVAAVSMDSDLVSVTNNTNDSNLEEKISTCSSLVVNIDIPKHTVKNEKRSKRKLSNNTSIDINNVKQGTKSGSTISDTIEAVSNTCEKADHLEKSNSLTEVVLSQEVTNDTSTIKDKKSKTKHSRKSKHANKGKGQQSSDSKSASSPQTEENKSGVNGVGKRSSKNSQVNNCIETIYANDNSLESKVANGEPKTYADIVSANSSAQSGNGCQNGVKPKMRPEHESNGLHCGENISVSQQHQAELDLKKQEPVKPEPTAICEDQGSDQKFVKDSLIYVSGCDTQPVVPQYLRDPDYLTHRQIARHDTLSTGAIFLAMNKIMEPPSGWVRVISVTFDLELRVRHETRDALLETLERKGICDPKSKPPNLRLLKVGSLVAAVLDVPRRGLIWCRVVITQVIPTTNRKRSRPYGGSSSVPLFHYMVESVDYFPAQSPRPLRAADLRPLTPQALNAPFFDQLICLRNVMPANAIDYSSSAREELLDILKKGSNFLVVSEKLQCTFISGVCYWMAESLLSHHQLDGINKAISLEEALVTARHALPIYTGSPTHSAIFEDCIFAFGEAFWGDDDRCPSSLLASCGDPNPDQEYIWLQPVNETHIRGIRGFRLPFKHAKNQSLRAGFNMSLYEFSIALRQFNIKELQIKNPDEVIRKELSDPKAVIGLNFTTTVLVRFYQFDSSRTPSPESLLVINNLKDLTQQAFVKDENGFLLFGNEFFQDFNVRNMREPVLTL